MRYATLVNLTCAIALALTLGGQAQADSAGGGYYVELFGGSSSIADTALSGAVVGTSGFGGGQAFGGAVGYAYGGTPLRAELEYTYRNGEADGAAGVTGDYASTIVALNGYYDFRPIGGAGVVPYIGAGFGYITEIDFDVAGGAAPGEYSERGGFGYQLMLGAAYPVSDRWSLTAEVRYFDAGSQTLTSTTGSLSAEYQTLDIALGTALRF
ncbi:MAG: outer membrane beta-barrel protein [Pseudomonadota bacterium]